MHSPLTPQQAANGFALLLSIVRDDNYTSRQMREELELQLESRIDQGILGDDNHPEFSNTSANYLAAQNYGRIDALEGEPNTRFSGPPNGTESENAVWPQIRAAYLAGFNHQSTRILHPAQLKPA